MLLHFEQTTSAFKHISEISKRIKKHKEDYNKDKKPLTYADIKDKTQTAIKNAKAILKNGHGDNPSTKVHILVEDLIKQAQKI